MKRATFERKSRHSRSMVEIPDSNLIVGSTQIINMSTVSDVALFMNYRNYVRRMKRATVDP